MSVLLPISLPHWAVEKKSGLHHYGIRAQACFGSDQQDFAPRYQIRLHWYPIARHLSTLFF